MDASVQANPKIRRTLTRYFAADVVAFLLIGVFGLVFASCQEGATQGLNLEPAPDFTTNLYSGGTGEFTLSAYYGYPIVLNFWGSWCPPCRAEFPVLQHAANQYEAQGVVFFGVDVQDAEADARQFLTEEGTAFFTGPDLDNQISIDYRVTSFPTTFFITRDGNIYKRWMGLIDDKRLTENIEELLKL